MPFAVTFMIGGTIRFGQAPDVRPRIGGGCKLSADNLKAGFVRKPHFATAVINRGLCLLPLF